MLCSRVALLCSLDQSPLPILRGTPDGDQPIDSKCIRLPGLRQDCWRSRGGEAEGAPAPCTGVADGCVAILGTGGLLCAASTRVREESRGLLVLPRRAFIDWGGYPSSPRVDGAHHDPAARPTGCTRSPIHAAAASVSR